jgi:hypothetical protein
MKQNSVKKRIRSIFNRKQNNKQFSAAGNADSDSLNKSPSLQQVQGEDFKLKILRNLVNLEAKRITPELIILFALALGFAAFVLWMIFSHVQSVSIKIPPW